jgi:glycosyltransferase involved in cell wall biosynthesis
VHTSAAEGLSLVVIMAQMLKTPVISTDSDGLGEVVRSPYTGEELAAIIQGDDPANLARLMMESIHKTPKLMERTRAAMNSALERFTEKQMIDGFERLYLRLTRAYDSSLRDQKAA